MFKVSTWSSIGGYNCPAVFELLYAMCSHINHGFYSNGHAINKFLSASAFSIVRHFGVFVKFFSQAVSNKLSYHTIAMTFTIILNGKTNVSNTITFFKFADAQI